MQCLWLLDGQRNWPRPRQHDLCCMSVVMCVGMGTS
jgi:hypothetical protein